MHKNFPLYFPFYFIRELRTYLESNRNYFIFGYNRQNIEWRWLEGGAPSKGNFGVPSS